MKYKVENVEGDIYRIVFDENKNYEIYINKEKGIVSRFYNKEYLERNDYDPNPKRKPDFNYFIFDLTFNCTLRCKHCYNEYYTKNRNLSMDKESLKLALDRIFDYLDKKDRMYSTLIFHGGEPTLYPDLIEFACKYIYQNDFEEYINLGIQTNATVITNRLIRIFKKYMKGRGVGVSIEGPRDINDKIRVFPDGSSSFDIVMKNIERLKMNGINVGILITINKYSATRIDEVFYFIHKNINNGCGSNIIFGNPDLKPSKEQMEVFADKAIMYVVSSYYQRNYFSYREFEHACLYCFTPERLNCDCSPCGGASNIISITYNLNVYPCNRINVDKYCLGNLFDKSLKDMENSQAALEFRRRSWKNMECKDCIIGAICQGKCAAEAYYKYGTIHNKSEVCEEWKIFYMKILQYASMGILNPDVVSHAINHAKGRGRKPKL